MENAHLNQSALDDCLRSLHYLFVDIARLKYEQGYEEIVGGYCELKVATLDSGNPTAKLVAVKRLRLGTREIMPKRLAFRLARELKVWAGLQHPHVLPLLGFYLCNEYKSAVLISEYMGHGDLKKYITLMKPVFDQRISLVRDLTDGLAYLHTQDAPIRHGDLKPGNVLVNSNRRALLADFGLSKALGTGPTGFTTGNDAKGTIRYSSPEILLYGTAAESLSNDIWSWGCLVLETLTDKIPFADIQPEPQLILALAQGRSPYEANNISLLPQSLGKMVANCLNRQPQERLKAPECLNIIQSIPLALAIERAHSTKGIELLSPDFNSSSSPVLSTRAPGPVKRNRDFNVSKERARWFGEKVPGMMEQVFPRRQSGEPHCIVIEDDEDDAEEEAVSFDRPPILSTGVADRIRLQGPSMTPWRSYNGPGSATHSGTIVDPTLAEERGIDSVEDAVEDDRPRKRIRAAVDPPALSSYAAPNIARRARALVSESPDALHPQFAFPHPHIPSAYPWSDGSTYPPPAFRAPATQNDRAQQIPGAIARTAATLTLQDERAYQAKPSHIGPSHSYQPSGESGAPSPGLSHSFRIRPPAARPPLSGGTSETHTINPYSQQQSYTDPGSAPNPTPNAQGWRSCGQCGQPGRYKDVAGPGTVCARCCEKTKWNAR